jgi:hypothetical protein
MVAAAKPAKTRRDISIVKAKDFWILAIKISPWIALFVFRNENTVFNLCDCASAAIKQIQANTGGYGEKQLTQRDSFKEVHCGF